MTLGASRIEHCWHTAQVGMIQGWTHIIPETCCWCGRGREAITGDAVVYEGHGRHVQVTERRTTYRGGEGPCNP